MLWIYHQTFYLLFSSINVFRVCKKFTIFLIIVCVWFFYVFFTLFCFWFCRIECEMGIKYDENDRLVHWRWKLGFSQSEWEWFIIDDFCESLYLFKLLEVFFLLGLSPLRVESSTVFFKKLLRKKKYFLELSKAKLYEYCYVI